jgi:hypothetical protein
MSLRLFHTTLPVQVTEEGQHVVKRLIRSVQHVGKRPSLSVFEKPLSRNADGTWHRWHPLRVHHRNPSETAAGEAWGDPQIGLALRTSQATVQSEELAGRYPRHSELPDGRILGHVNTLNLFDGQTDGSCDYGIVGYPHLHNGNCGGDPIGHLDVELPGSLPGPPPRMSCPSARVPALFRRTQAQHESSSFITHGQISYAAAVTL